MKNEMKNKIFQSVDSLRDEMIQILSELVKIESVTPKLAWEPEISAGKESLTNRRMKEILEQMGAECELFAKDENRENLCARYKGTGGGPSLMFNGHVDVVPPGDETGWTEAAPFSGYVDDTYVHGRGTVDMKGGNTAAVFALKALHNAGIKLKGDVIFTHVVGEEVKDNLAGTTACLEHGYTADAAIVCEPSCADNLPFQIHTCTGGVAEFQVVVKGKGCHIGVRKEAIRDCGLGSPVGVNAIDKGLIIYNAIKELERQWGQSKTHNMFEPGQFVINDGMIQGGIARSTVAPEITLDYAILFPPQNTYEEIKEEIENCIFNACQNDPWLKKNPPEITWLFDWPAFEVNPDIQFVNTIQNAVQEVTPDGGEITSMRAVCDAPFITEHGIPAVILGPGNFKYAHTEGEKIEIQNVAAAAKIYALAMAEWCQIEQEE